MEYTVLEESGEDSSVKASSPSRPSPLVRRQTRKLTNIELSTKDGRLPKTIAEEDWEQYINKGILFPHAPRKFRWDLLMLVLILYSCITVPFRLGMDHQAKGYWWFVEVMVSLVFIADIVLSFQTAVLEGDRFVLDRKLIRASYLRGWFTVDLLSSMPMELVDLVAQLLFPQPDENGPQGGSVNRLLRALRLVRLLRVLRLLKIQSYINLLEDALSINLQLIQLFKVTSGLVYLAHVLGCFWFWLANSAETSDNTWIAEFDSNPEFDNVWVQYLYSVYCAQLVSTSGLYDTHSLLPWLTAPSC